MDFSNITTGISKVIEIWEPILNRFPNATLTSNTTHHTPAIILIINDPIDSMTIQVHRTIRWKYLSGLAFPDHRNDND